MGFNSARRGLIHLRNIYIYINSCILFINDLFNYADSRWHSIAVNSDSNNRCIGSNKRGTVCRANVGNIWLHGLPAGLWADILTRNLIRLSIDAVWSENLDK